MRPSGSYRSQRRPSHRFHEFEHGEEIVIAQIRNLSRFGARVDGDFNLAGPDVVSLIYGGRKHPANIVWIQFGALGLAFHTPLDKATFAGVLGVRMSKSNTQKPSRFLAN